ncbi:MAG: hypothetical protein ABF289_11950 [Clostridiales bacterium]
MILHIIVTIIDEYHSDKIIETIVTKTDNIKNNQEISILSKIEDT